MSDSQSVCPLGIIAVCQFTAKKDKDENFRICESLVRSAAAEGAKMIFLPEKFDYITKRTGEAVAMADHIHGNIIRRYAKLAQQRNVWLSLGGYHQKESHSKYRLTHIIINNNGSIVATYDKIHSFNVDVPGFATFSESGYSQEGSEIVPPISTPIGNVTLGIGYDVSFPELGLLYRNMGADIMAFPSAYVYKVGATQFEVLMRSCAINTQCYVVASAQCGKHSSRIESWGHAMVVDPLGNITAQCSSSTGYVIASINMEIVKATRLTMPLMDQRRYDLYPEMVVLKDKNYFTFGQIKVSKETVFLKTEKSMAFTNKRCVVPGHVLVAPLRVVARLRDMTESEISDMFNLVKRVQSIIENVHNVTSSNIVIQDGYDAGQRIQHVHVHIIPRKSGDFKDNDELYYILQNHGRDAENAEKWRSEKEMVIEANILNIFTNRTN